MNEHPMITAAKDAFFAAELNGTAVDKSVTAALQWLEDPKNVSDAVIKSGLCGPTWWGAVPEQKVLRRAFIAMIKQLRKEIEGHD